jgi:DNA-binding IclR family transcriptional regulator
MTVKTKIISYLASRKTPATAKEIASYAKLNYNTVRRLLGEMLSNGVDAYDNVKCKVDKAYRTGYTLG